MFAQTETGAAKNPYPLAAASASASASATATEAVTAAASKIRLLATENNGNGSWGDRGDLMGLLVRLAFHDAATYNVTIESESESESKLNRSLGGVDGCVDLDSLENRGLKEAIDLLEPIRRETTFLEGGGGASMSTSTSMLSRADIWALAANVMIETAKGPSLEFKVGRIDAEAGSCAGQGSTHVSAESTSSVETSTAFVDRMGFTHREVVALIGAHVLGKASRANSGYEGKWVKENDVFSNTYFIDLVHKPWTMDPVYDPTFGKRTTWRLFDDDAGLTEDEIMLQTDVDLAFETAGKQCFRVGGEFRASSSCPNATHSFSSHVRDFALDKDAWHAEFAVAWAKLTSLTPVNETQTLSCATPDCLTPTEPSSSSTLAMGLSNIGAFVAIATIRLLW